MAKTKIELESINHSWEINLNNIKISNENLELTQKAWAENHHVYYRVWGSDLKNIWITIYTVSSPLSFRNMDEDITKDWNGISKMLKSGEIPDAWVYRAIETVKKNKEESYYEC